MGDKKKYALNLSPITHHLSLFRTRSYELEHLDKGDYTNREYENCLVELRRINRYLGDARALREGVLKEIEKDLRRKERSEFSLLDVGAGSGELLREAATWGAKKNTKAKCVGVELNDHAARSMKRESSEYPNIFALRADGFRLPFAAKSFDYTICSLFAHHFREAEIVRLLQEFRRVARKKIFVLDLHRHAAAYLLYTTLGRIVLHNRLVRADGALSIKRAFVASELETLARDAGFDDFNVRRVFPFRLVLKCKV